MGWMSRPVSSRASRRRPSSMVSPGSRTPPGGSQCWLSTHAGTHILPLVQDLEVRIINAATGELLRDLTLDPDRIYQPTGKPPGPLPGTPRPPRKTQHPEP